MKTISSHLSDNIGTNRKIPRRTWLLINERSSRHYEKKVIAIIESGICKYALYLIRQGILAGKFELTPSTGDLCGRCLSFIIPLKETA